MSSEVLEKARAYEEKYSVFIKDEDRPAFHLSPRIGWMNDPNGFSLYQGQYHLFYQYHPYSTQWGPMHWGHVVSRDMLRWTYLPAAIAPDQEYDQNGCFSGSALELPDGRQLLLYTGVREKRREDGTRKATQTQCLALGDGLDYEKCPQNPVLDEKDVPQGFSHHDFRDPKIYRRSDGGFACVVGDRTDDGSGAILLYESEDGMAWRFVTILDRSYNEYGKMWECPDFFALDGHQLLFVSPQDMSQVGLEFHNGNGTVCFIGAYDEAAKSYQRQRAQAIDYGIDFYAPQTLLTEDGRRVMIAWMQNWDTAVAYPAGTKWFGQMTLPRELHVRDGRLIQTPIRELEALRGRRVAYENVPVGEESALRGIYGRVLDMTVTIRPRSDKLFELFRLKFAKGSQHYSDIVYDPRVSTLRISRTHSGCTRDFVHERECFVRDRGGELKLRLVLDRFSAEVFVNDGEQALSMTIYTPMTANGISFEARGDVLMDVEKFDILA